MNPLTSHVDDRPHVVKRLVVELSIADAAQAERLASEVSRLRDLVIAPLLERLCSELPPGRSYRIDSLDVDLGTVSPDGLETALRAGLRKALGEALGACARRDEPAPPGNRTLDPADAWLEQFVVFARTGALPWWVDARRPGLLGEGLRGLVEQAPAALSAALRALAPEPNALWRIALSYDEAELSQLFALLVDDDPRLQAVADDLPAALVASGAASRGPFRWRSMLWRALLESAGRPPGDTTSLCRAALSRFAAVTGTLTYDALVSELQQLAVSNASSSPRAISDAVPAPVSHELRTVINELHAERFGATTRSLSSPESDPRTAHLCAPVEASAQAASLPQPFESDSSADRLAPTLARQGNRPPRPTPTERPLGRSSGEPSGEVSSGQQAQSQLSWRAQGAPSPRGARPFDFGEPNERYVSNAGLTLLWPFLGHFFARLGLLEDRQFKTEGTAQRAVGLLQHVVTGEPEPPEYLLTLNKLLCGVELDAICDVGAPASADEAEECDQLVAAALEHAPMLKQLAASNVRSMFLQREGVLRRRDGAWLLNVERRPYDVVLERVPWGLAWVKLPWMGAPLRVEW